MKKTLFITLCLLFTFALLKSPAQNQSKLQLKVAIGLLPTYLKDKPKTIIPSLSFGVNYRVHEKISLEGYFAYSCSQTKCEKPGPVTKEPLQEWQNNLSILGLKSAIHTSRMEKWDIYGGMMINYNITKINVISGSADYMREHLGIKPSNSKISISGFVGAMYMLSGELSLYSELGFGICLLSAGLGYRF